MFKFRNIIQKEKSGRLLLSSRFNFCDIQREEIETDVLIVGGGPARLATAIKLKQLAKLYSKEIDVSIVELRKVHI
jgi:ribulose 1,5-bisphosphate synthetase/thiazole synthase